MKTDSLQKRSPVLPAIALLLFWIILPACGSSLKPFAGHELRGGEGVRMAILPFENLSKGQGAGKTMGNYILVEFLKRSSIRISDPGEVAEALSKERVRLTTSISKGTLIALGKTMNVNLFLLGTVHDYDMQMASGAGGTGQVPVVAFSLRILDASTGEIVWAGNAARRGTDRETVFGLGRIQSLDRLAEETAKEFAEAFAASLKKP